MSDPRALAQTLHTGWTQLDAATRQRIESALVAAVTQQLERDPWYSSFSNPPAVEVLGISHSDGTLHVHFLADHLNYCYAQSGSDWADHNLFTGKLSVPAATPESPPSIQITPADHVFVSERTYDDGYDRTPAKDRVRAALLSGLLATFAGSHRAG